jgi:aryl-alcohol dehydrogenase-like predicted oxidoreductase
MFLDMKRDSMCLTSAMASSADRPPYEGAEPTSRSPGSRHTGWLMARKGVTAQIASTTSVAQLESFAKAANLSLTADDVATLEIASR